MEGRVLLCVRRRDGVEPAGAVERNELREHARFAENRPKNGLRTVEADLTRAAVDAVMRI